MDKLIEDKLTVVLNLIRTNNSADEVLKITQAFDNLTRAKISLLVNSGSNKPKGAAA